MLKKHNFIFIVIICIVLASSPVHAKGPTDESAIFVGFTSLASDVLILLDASQGMLLNPAGGTEKWGTSSCSAPFYASPDATNNTDCSRLAISKRAVFGMLDSSQNGVIDSSDPASLNVRFGYMRFSACAADDTGASFASGCNEVIWPIGTNYSTIYCNASSCTSTSGSSTADCVNSESASGGSALASALNEAKLYLNYSKSNDSTAGDCRMKSVLLITAGEDTLSCGGNGQTDQSDQYKRRRNSVAMAKALADAGYKLYVVGFGTNMPVYVQNTLNWMGYYGGTQNTNVADLGDKSAFNPALNGGCVDSLPTTTACGTSGLTTCAANNDPGTASLSGFAFFADNTSALAQMLSQTISSIRAVDYSFATASVASSRVKDENNIYEGSLTYNSNDPFWQGHLKKYDINADGTVGAAVWDAGGVLASTSSNSRNIYALKAGSLVAFTAGNVTPQDLGYTSSDTASRDKVIGYIKGDSSYNPDGWKLGDVFRSTPMTIGSPSPYYQDIRDTSTCTWTESGVTKSGNAFDCFRATHQRTSAGGNRLILVGANDGQLHAFKTGDGTEAWSIIPPNLLPKLQTIVHTAHPTSLTHQYFVDGPVSVADIWMGSGDGKSKSSSDWKTLMIFGEGRGASSSYLWSSSSSCDSGFNATYTTAYKYYCGFYALDVSNSLSPLYRWHLSPNAAQAPYLGDPWGKFFIGRVKISGNEKWVGFIGGGYNSADCKTGKTCDSRGKGFFVVDLSDGSILWSYVRVSNGMDYSLAGSPAIVDSDNDGFIDTAYIGDLGGNMWRFKFCSSLAGSSCSTADWNGGMLYAASSGEIRPIYTTPSVARDSSGNIWVYWGTGDKSDPTASNAQEKMYAVQDNDRTTQYTNSSLENITSDSKTYSGSGAGWYMNLSGSGQKILADPTVFGGVLYFTVYTPGDNKVCSQAGTADLFGVTATTGSGIFSSGRSMNIGSGIPTAPVISFKAGGSPDMYVTVSGGAGVTANTQRVNFNPPGVSNRSSVLYWRDRRLR